MALENKEQALIQKMQDKNIKVISFDIFDTLVYRPVTAPTDLFYLLKQDSQRILKDKSIDFRILRTMAEREARKLHSEVEDITIHEIYDYMTTHLEISKKHAQEIKQLEIALELKYIFPRKKMQEIFQVAKSLGKKIILTTDMYLTKDELLPMLNKCGYRDFDEIFISCEYRKTKASGNLYKEILQTLKLEPKQILHIGDNKHSDIEMAQKFGIQCFYTPKIMDLFRASKHREYWQPIEGRIMGYSAKLLLGIIAAQLFDDPFQEIAPNSFYQSNTYGFAYACLGPIFFSLALWMLQDSSKEKYDKIFFLSRDGYLPKLIYDKLKPYFPEAPSSEYLYSSRSAHKSAYLRQRWGVTKSLETMPYNRNFRNLKGILAARFGLKLSEQECAEIQADLQQLEFISSGSISNILAGYIPQIMAKAESEYSVAKQYYCKQFHDLKHPVVFDLGVSGSSIEGLCCYLGRETLPFYYLIGLFRERETLFSSGKLFYQATLNDYLDLANPLMEKITQSDEGSCAGFEQKDEIIQPIFAIDSDDAEDTAQKRQIQQGILDFCDACTEIFANDVQKIHLEKHLFIDNLLHTLTETSSKELIALLGRLRYENDFGGNTSVYISAQIFLHRKPSYAWKVFQARWSRFKQLSHRRKFWALARGLSKRMRLYRLLQPIAKVLKRILEKKK